MMNTMYGGTKQEMARLLADAEKLTGVKYDINNLSDVYSAIHAIQGKLDITGTTAKEAASTLTGSFNAMKASFTNVLGALALGENLKPALQNLVKTTGTFLFKNLIPMVWNILRQIPEALVTIFQEVGSMIFEQGGIILTNFLNGIKQQFPQFAPVIDGITSKFSEIWTKLQVIIPQVFATIGPMVMTGMQFIKDAILPIFETIVSWVQTNWPLIQEYISAVMDNIKLAITRVLDSIKMFWDNWGSTILNLVKKAWDGVKSVIEGVLNIIKGFMNVSLGLIKGDWSRVWEGIKQIVSGVWDSIKGIVTTAINSVKAIITTVWGTVKSFTSTTWNAIKDSISNVWNSIKTAVSNAVNSVKNTVGNVWESLKTTTTNTWNNIKKAMQDPIESAKNFIKTQIDKIVGFFSGMKIRFPKIALPHFSIVGSFSLRPPSVPRLSVEWYKDGGILKKPTMFGINGTKAMVGGEAGPEAILPLNKLPGLLMPALNRMLQGNEAGNEVTINNYNQFTLENVQELTREKLEQISQWLAEDMEEKLTAVGGGV